MNELAGKHVVLIVENEAVPFDRRMWNIAKALREFGATVSVICPVFGNDKEKVEVTDGIAIYRYNNTFSDGSICGYLKEYMTAFVKTLALFHKILFHYKSIDIVHAANPPD